MYLRIIIRIFCKALCAASLSKWQVWSQGLGSRGECLAIYAPQRDDNYIEIGLPGRKLDKAIRAYPGIQLIWTWATRPAALTNWTFFQSVLTHATGLDELCRPQCFCSAAISSFPRTQIVQVIFSVSGGYIDCTNCIMYSADSPPFHSMFAKARHARNDAPPWLCPLWVCLSQMNLLCFWNETCSFRIGSAILSWETKEIEGEAFLLILLIIFWNNTVSAVYMCQAHQCGAEITAAQRSKGQEDSFWKST